MTAKQFLLLLPETDRTKILDMMKQAYAKVGDCNGITAAEALYKESINIIEKD